MLNYKAHLKQNPVSVGQLGWNLDWTGAVSCAKCGKEKKSKHMQLFDATGCWDLTFPAAFKVRNCDNSSREAPGKPVSCHEISRRIRLTLKNQLPVEYMLREHSLVATRGLWVHSWPCCLQTFEQNATYLLCFCFCICNDICLIKIS